MLMSIRISVAVGGGGSAKRGHEQRTRKIRARHQRWQKFGKKAFLVKRPSLAENGLTECF